LVQGLLSDIEGGLGVRNLILFNCTLLGKNGFGTMCMREGPYGESLWISNMVACGAGGVLMRFMGRMGWVCEKISGGVVVSFLVIPDLRREMALKLDSSMTSGVGIRSLRIFSPICIVLLV